MSKIDFSPVKKQYNNLLPKDGTVHYFPALFLDAESSENEAEFYFQALWQNIAWENDENIIFGKKIITKRKVAFYGENGLEYTYSRVKKKALPWTKELLAIKEMTEKLSGERFNACLLNLYHDGNEGMGWHSDDEKEMKKYAAIASVSLGAERKFSFKHKKTKETCSLYLENGSLLLMKNETQENWLHALPKSKKVTAPRINLTFRTIIS